MSNKNQTRILRKTADSFVNSQATCATAAKFLLMVLALGSIVFAGAIAPGLLYFFQENNYPKKYSGKKLRNSFYNLRRRKLIEIIEESENMTKVKLTNKGKKRVKELCFETLAINKPRYWDKKWRVLIFDIPTKPRIYNQAREALRSKIKTLGFYQMQKSVWVYPYQCEDEIIFIAELFQVQKFIEILTVDKMLHENVIKNVFSL